MKLLGYLKIAMTSSWNFHHLKSNFFSCCHSLHTDAFGLWLSCLVYHVISSWTLWVAPCAFSLRICSYHIPTNRPCLNQCWSGPGDSGNISWMKGWIESATSRESLGFAGLGGEGISMASLAGFITLPFTAYRRPHSQGLCKSLGVIPSLTHFLWLSF